MPQEFETTGVPSRQRARRLEEGIMAMRAVWGADPVSFAGEFTTIPLSDIGPKPLSPQGPTLILGGWADAALRRAGRLGLGINLILDAVPVLRRQVQLWRQAAEEAGHSPDGLDVVVRTNLVVGEHRGATKLGFAAWPLPDLVGDLRELSAAGVTEIFYELHDATAPVEQLVDDLAAVRAEMTT
jgi:alkanesulfonate monooxygenase SsuD/methylene tetrahydromethanopterin reductase-like flavin-dependent oxidoreductase (luciferase family)